MKKILLLMTLALFAVQGFSMEKAVKSDNTSENAVLVTVDNDATLTTCRIWLEAINGYVYLRSQYPVASTVEVILDGPSFAGMSYYIPQGSTESNTNLFESALAEGLGIAAIMTSSDNTYQYVF